MALRYEWQQITFGPENWRAVLGARRPAMLFVESAWNGNNGAWRLHMTKEKRPSAELRALVEWCRAAGIPTVFWNKEDPPNYDVFIATAKLFDQVITVHAERIPIYPQHLRHTRPAPLPFPAPPPL